MINKLASTVVSEYMGRCMEGDNKKREGTITVVARVDECMYVIVVQLSEYAEESKIIKKGQQKK